MRDAWYFRVVGRLKTGVTIGQAQAEMDALAVRLQQAYPASNRDAGVRIALGAAPQAVRGLVIGRTLKIAAAGTAAGAAASVGLSRHLGAWLHGVSGADPLVFAAGAAVLFGTALAAGYFPAHRASAIDPITAMKAE